MNKSSSSSVAQGSLKLNQEQADDGDGQGSGVVNCLELRLGISSDNGSCSPWRVDPWSLAARQEKASLEKGHLMRPDDESDPQRETGPAPTAAPPQLPVGWPPVRAFRKNLSSSAKPTTDDALVFSNKVMKPCSEDEDDDHGAGGGAPMFVKVNLEGCVVGRKVDLRAHRGYGALSRALQSMFRGFLLSDGQWTIASSSSSGGNNKDEDDEQLQHVETKKKTYILLYEDNEGDRMLVGDVPWELFVVSVKRLYIAQDTRTLSSE